MDHVSSCTYITKAKYYFITIESRITIRCEIRFELRVVVGLIFYFRFILNFLLLDFRFELLIWFNKRENRISLHIYSFSWLYWNMASFHSLALSNYLTKTVDVHINHMHLNHFYWWSVEMSLAMPHLLLLFWSNNPRHLD